jgi:hypothetical protein
VIFAPATEGHSADRLIVNVEGGAPTSIALDGEATAAMQVQAAAMPSDSAVRPYAAAGIITQPGPDPNALDNGSCVNREPVLSVPSDVFVEIGKQIRFSVTAVDPDGDMVALAAASLPPGAAFDATSGAFTFTPMAACGQQIGRSYQVEFIATDSRGMETSAPVHVTVVGSSGIEAREPIISAPAAAMRVAPGETLRFRVAASTPDGCQTAITADTALGRFDVSTGEYVFTAAASAAHAMFDVPFRASECSGTSSRLPVRIEIRPASTNDRGAVALPVDLVDFAPAQAGSENGYVILPITNSGNAPLTIERIAFASGKQFHVDGNLGLPVVLFPGRQLPIRIAFQPDAAGDFSDTLNVETSDVHIATVKLTGRGN